MTGSCNLGTVNRHKQTENVCIQASQDAWTSNMKVQSLKECVPEVGLHVPKSSAQSLKFQINRYHRDLGGVQDTQPGNGKYFSF